MSEATSSTDCCVRGHAVRAAVRSPDRADEVRAGVAADGLDPAAVEFAVADLGSDEGWPEAVADVRYVLHVASPFPAQNRADDEEIIAPARDGALRVLRAARDAGCSRVVLTSSFAAVGYSPKGSDTWSEQDWTDPSSDNTAYIRSKAIAERAAWDFVAAVDGGLELVTVIPVGIFGPTLGPHLSTSVQFVRSMLAGELKRVVPQYFGVVDVRDVADAHISAMTTADAAGHRFLVVADGGPLSFLDIAGILRDGLGRDAAEVPDAEYTVEEMRGLVSSQPALREALVRISERPQISNARAKDVLGFAPRPVRDTILDTGRSLIERGLV